MVHVRLPAVGLLVAFGAGLLAACAPAQAPAAGPVAGPRAIPVRTARAASGPITVTSAYAGSVQAQDQVNVVPLATGRIEKLSVDIGSEVKRGQVIAELSHGTLDAQLQQAQAGVKNAQARLASLAAGSKPEEIAVAASQLRATKTRLDAMLAGARAEQMAIAQAQLDSTRARLDQLLNPSPADLQAAQSAVTAAQANLDIARIKLTQLKSPSTADVATAYAAVSAAEAALATVEVKLDTLKNPTPTDLSTAYSSLVSAQATLDARKSTLAGLTRALNRTPTAEDEAKARADVEVAQSSVVAAQARLDQVKTPLPSDLKTATANVTSAQAALDSARAKLRQLLSPSPNDIAVAEANVASAQAALEAAQARLSLLKSPNPADVAAARAAVAQAEQNLAILKTPYDLDVQLQKESVAQAEQTLAIRQKPYTTQDMEAAQAAVDQAQAQVNLVLKQLEEVRVLAPFDGLVIQRFLSPGALASAQTPIVSLVSKGSVVSLRIEEARIGALQVGQAVTLSSPGLPGQVLEGRVALVSPGGDERRHTFAIQVDLASPGTALKPGMSAQVTIATRRDNAVLVPKEALLLRNDLSILFVAQDGKALLRTVDVGLVDDRNAEVRTGVRAGDEVVVSGQSLLSDGDPVTIERPGEQQRPPGGRPG